MADYTIARADEVTDYTGDAPGAFLGYGRALDAEQVGFNVRVLEPGTTHVPPGEDPSWGHAHKDIEEIYFVLDGTVTAKLDDEVVTLGPRDAVRVPAHTVRSLRNEGDSIAAFVMCSVKAADPRAESVPQPGFWS